MASQITDDDVAGKLAPLNLERLIAIRWAVLGMALALILAVPAFLDIALPHLPLLAVIGVMGGINGLLHRRHALGSTSTSIELASQIAFDIAGLGALLFFSGGATNPLVSLLLLPVAVAALILPGSHVLAIGTLAVATYSALMVFYLPLPLSDPARATRLHLVGMWMTFAVSAAMIGLFVVHMMARIRQRDAELALAREQAIRDERVLALGTLAAGAAHELGTPLATMAVIVGELERETGLSSGVQDDLNMLRRQITACKEIITGLSRQAGSERMEQVRALQADTWLETLCQRWQSLRPKAHCRFTRESGSASPTIIADPTLEQALLNLLNNAADTGSPAIEVTTAWDQHTLTITIRDHGPGFATDILRQAGKAPFPAHAGGSGIGLLLTRSALERLGGQLSLSNHPMGGAVARATLPIARP